MNFNEYLEEAYNDLRLIKPEWAEVAQPDSAINIIAQVLAMYKPLIEASYQEMLDNCNLDSADLQHLIRSYGAISKVYYQGATKTKYIIDVVATGEDTLPSGWQVQDTAGNIYQTTSTTNIVAGTNKVEFEALETGNITSVSGTINIILSPRTTITSVSNNEPVSYIGTANESEESYRIRCKTEQQYGVGATKTLTNDLIKFRK